MAFHRNLSKKADMGQASSSMPAMGKLEPDSISQSPVSSSDQAPGLRKFQQGILDFAAGFVAEAAKGNLILFSAILGGFGIFFTERIFWLTFGLAAVEAFFGICAPSYMLPFLTEKEQRELLQLGAHLRSSKVLYLGIPLLVSILREEISQSTSCNDVCQERGELALELGLGSLLVLETLPMFAQSLILLCNLQADRRRSEDLSSSLPSLASNVVQILAGICYRSLKVIQHPRIFSSLVCSAVSGCIAAIVLLIVGGSYAIFMGWQSFTLCWFVLAIEILVEGVQRAESVPAVIGRWRLFCGAVIRVPLQVTAFLYLQTWYKHLHYAAPALDNNLCDVVCQKRLQGLLSALTFLCCIQAGCSFCVLVATSFCAPDPLDNLSVPPADSATAEGSLSARVSLRYDDSRTIDNKNDAVV